MNIFLPFLATAIGSFPHDSAEDALAIIMERIPEAPVWPQLPGRSPLEGMEIQYSEGMPRASVDRERSRLSFDTSGDYSEDFATFYETYLAAMDPDGGDGDCSALAVSGDYSLGIGALEAALMKDGTKRPYVKVQVTGPCSFSLTSTDENKRAIYYNEEFRDVIVKALAMKARWQIQKFAPYCGRVICFIDEPILSAFGSSTYISVRREDMVAMIAEMTEAIHRDGAAAGVHCCGNTDWSILVDAGVDIVNFDAYGYGETVALYPEAMAAHLDRGGVLAWGIVPTSAEIRNQSVATLTESYRYLVGHLAEKSGIDRGSIEAQTILTPSCGTGTLNISDTERVFELLQGVSSALRGTR